jgi:hypothetical protein
MLMKIIAFSLWGDDKLYCQGAIDNIACAKEHYPDWTCRFYVAYNCPALPVLDSEDCQVVIIEQDANTIDRTQEIQKWHWDINNVGMMWRFWAMDDPDVERVIFRDCDSRVGARDAQAVKEWEDTDYAMHRMHECKAHWNAQVMGGMWGIKGGVFKNIKKSTTEYVNRWYRLKGEPWIFVDLWWIMDALWPHLKYSCMGHGYGHPNPFSVDGPMVGAVVREEWRGQKYVP